MKTKNKGISLIVLVITIIVVIIIAAAVILTLTSNNPIAEARKATFLSDIDAFKSELDMYNTTQYATTMGNYDLTSADFSVTADENMLYTVIPSLKGKTKYRSHFEVIDGGLAYTGIDEEKIDLAKNVAGIMTTNAKPEITLTTSNILPVKAGASVAYTVGMSATVPITIANLSGNVKVLNDAGTELATQPSISVGTVSGTTADKERSAVVTINTTRMIDGTYKIKVLNDAVQTAGSKNVEKVSTAPVSGWTTFTNGATLSKIGPGTFYLWIKVTDNAGNISTIRTNAFILTAPIYNFAYTGAAQTWTVPYTGTYKLETWGAQGGDRINYSGSSSYYGGKGGYSAGNMTLTAGQTIYIYVGGQGSGYTGTNAWAVRPGGFNGGGSANGASTSHGSSGGGGTDIRVAGNALGNRVIVAGGGGRS